MRFEQGNGSYMKTLLIEFTYSVSNFYPKMRWIYTERHPELEDLQSEGILALITWADRWLLRDLVSSLERAICARTLKFKHS